MCPFHWIRWNVPSSGTSTSHGPTTLELDDPCLQQLVAEELDELRWKLNVPPMAGHRSRSRKPWWYRGVQPELQWLPLKHKLESQLFRLDSHIIRRLAELKASHALVAKV